MGRAAVYAVMMALNEEKAIEQALEGMDAQSHPIEELILVDGGSEDDTVRRAREVASGHGYDITIVEDTDGIVSGCQTGCDIAVERSDGEDVIIRTDADSVLSDNFAERAVELLDDPSNALVGTKNRPIDDALWKRLWLLLANSTELPVGRAMAFRSEDFVAVDGYRRHPDDTFEDWRWGEDRLLTEKLRERGTVVYDRQAYVRTQVPTGSMTRPKAVKAQIKRMIPGYRPEWK